MLCEEDMNRLGLTTSGSRVGVCPVRRNASAPLGATCGERLTWPARAAAPPAGRAVCGTCGARLGTPDVFLADRICPGIDGSSPS